MNGFSDERLRWPTQRCWRAFLEDSARNPAGTDGCRLACFPSDQPVPRSGLPDTHADSHRARHVSICRGIVADGRDTDDVHRRRFSPPRSRAFRTVPRAKIERAFRELIGVLKGYEAYASRHPHPPAAPHTRLVGFLIAILASTLLVPLPFSNILPGLAIGTVALASWNRTANSC